LCADCDRQAVTDLEQAWPDVHWHLDRDQEQQDQAVPERKAGGTWLSRFHR
jgi:hypothetical protein